MDWSTLIGHASWAILVIQTIVEWYVKPLLGCFRFYHLADPFFFDSLAFISATIQPKVSSWVGTTTQQ